MIANKKEFYGGVGLMAGFLVVLVLFFLPLYNGHNGLDYMDNLYNSISKGSAYYIPGVQEKTRAMDGQEVSMVLDFGSAPRAEAAAALFRQASAQAEMAGTSLSVQGDLGRILASALADAEAMYHNEGEKVQERYSMDPRRATYLWWLSLKAMDKSLKKQSQFNEASMAELVNTRAIETAYNYYGVEAQSIGDKIGMVLFSLAFYVIYTMWYGFSILFMFEGWGLRLGH